jgi:hypothetical protein
MSIKKVIFLHHSTGANLIKEGVLRDFLKLRLPDVEFWDHGYNLFPFNIALFHHTGLTDAKGKLTGTSYDVPNNNTNPDGFENIFSQLVTTKPKNTFSHLIGYDVIVLKSCYPVTKIKSDKQLEDYKKSYLKIRKRIDQFPNKLFVLFTPPPLRAALTKPEYAKRAKEFADWLNSKEYLEKRINLRVFNFFDLLINKETNTLKPEYCKVFPWDSHPNKKANREIAPLFVNFLTQLLL